MNSEPTVKKQTYAGLFMITLSTLMYEILLTRIFSVTMWYHFAFLAISVAMFGMTVGAILVYLFPQYFTQERARYHLALSALGFATSIVISFLTHLSIPFITHKSIVGLYSLTLTYVVIAAPFVMSGVCVCLALTKFPRRVSQLYAADLAGAALGCILLVYVLRITDGPTAVFAVAMLASLGALFFLSGVHHPRLKRTAVITCILLLAFTAVHTVFVRKQFPLLRLVWVKGEIEPRPVYEKWNSFSRIKVWGDPDRPERPFGWGLSSEYPTDRLVRQLGLNIDAAAGTILTYFDGDMSDLEHLKYDVTNIVHYIKSDADMLVVGSGGGRDILSALAFDQKSVVGVEINGDIIDAVNNRFGDFTGHLDQHPKVTFVEDEARSYITRLDKKFDILQVSLIDTWAATAAGAFVLTENSLYTTEAWEIFLQRLQPDGILSFSRWYFSDRPREMYRLTTLAVTALKHMGIENPRNHIIIVKRMHESYIDAPEGVGTMMVSNQPFSDAAIDTIEAVCQRLRFDVVLTPEHSIDSTFATIASGKNIDAFLASYPLNIAPPTDDSPFFFNMIRLWDLFKKGQWAPENLDFNMKAVYILGVLLVIVIGLTFLCIIVPLILTTKKADLKGSTSLFLFFAGIGLGFMLVEISQMQRLIVFLGHPTYGLSVVLFAMLLSSGLGSFSTQRINIQTRTVPVIRLLLLLGVLIIFGILTPHATIAFRGSTTPLRILVATGILLPLGFFMGMAFPLGMKIASTKSASLTPWLWGINGATSVCASVFAVAIALSSSISVSFWSGLGCYGLAFLAFVWASRSNG